MKLSKTAIGVLLFIIILLAAGYSAKSNASDGARISLGHSVINSELVVGGVAYEYNNWEASALLMQPGRTKNGKQGQLQIYSVSYLTKPGWVFKGIDPYFRLGVSTNNGSPLIGDPNFRLGIGFDFHDVWRLDLIHDSSAGIHSPNSGLDMIMLTYKIPPLF